MSPCPAAVWETGECGGGQTKTAVSWEMGGTHLWKHTHPFLSMSHGFTTQFYFFLCTHVALPCCCVGDWRVVVVELNLQVIVICFADAGRRGGAHMWKHTHPFLSMSRSFITILFISLHTCRPCELGCNGEL